MHPVGIIDQPPPGSLNDPLCLRIEGWLHAGARQAELAAVEIWALNRKIGETRVRLPRPDVARARQFDPDIRTGFSLFASAPELLGHSSVELHCRALFYDGSHAAVSSCRINLIQHDYRTNHYGSLADPATIQVHHRGDIYSSGPSSATPSPECVELILNRLGPSPVRVLDVGCGIGAYGRPLLAAGHDWLGVETKPSDCVELARLNLPHLLVDGRTLPFADGAFDATVCIEVLEHIADPVAFLAEIRRVTRQRLLISVPNLEILPYLQPHLAVPWHLLEADHKNFFTRSSLQALLRPHFRHVEVLCYAQPPLKTVENLPLYYHLFAHALV